MTSVPSSAKKHVVIYTDGACSGNPGPGGWGAVLRCNGKEKELYGSEKHTTNNRMEMTAVLEALRALKEPCEVILHTDSKYVMQGVTEWMTGWRRKGWKTASGAPVKNVDLWEALDAELKRHRASWIWVKGHAGDPDNERADALARKGTRENSG